jgi:hypothetical protein
MTRDEIGKTVKPIIFESLRKFGEYARPGISPEEYAEEIASQLRPDVRRISLLIALAKSVIGDEFGGEGWSLAAAMGSCCSPWRNLIPRCTGWASSIRPELFR